MEAYQQRVVDEKKELDDRVGKLMNFIASPKFGSVPHEEKSRLRIQLSAMQTYGTILGERIAHFRGDDYYCDVCPHAKGLHNPDGTCPRGMNCPAIRATKYRRTPPVPDTPDKHDLIGPWTDPPAEPELPEQVWATYYGDRKEFGGCYPYKVLPDASRAVWKGCSILLYPRHTPAAKKLAEAVAYACELGNDADYRDWEKLVAAKDAFEEEARKIERLKGGK